MKKITLLIAFIGMIALQSCTVNEENDNVESALSFALRRSYIDVVEVLQKWPLTMLIIVLQELIVYHVLDCESYIDFLQYYDKYYDK